MKSRVLFLAGWSILIASICVADEAEIRLNKRQQETILNEVVPACQLHNPAVLMKTLGPLAAKMDDRYLAGANALLAKSGIPSVEVMLTDARLQLVEQNASKGLLPPSRHELPVLKETIDDRIQQVFDDQDMHAVMGTQIPTPSKLLDYDKLFREIRFLNDQLITSRRFASYRKTLPSAAAVENDYDTLLKEIDWRIHELEERSIELRLRRLRHASAVFEPFDPQNPVASTPKNRLLAAHTLELDHQIIESFFRQRAESGTPVARQPLKAPDLLQELGEAVKTAKERAGGTIEKSRLLHAGIFWWLRGRYGAGVKFYGLVKADAAKRVAAAQNQLYMPLQMPASSDSYPTRRHHYQWMWEERTLQVRRVYVPGQPRPRAGPSRNSQPPVTPVNFANGTHAKSLKPTRTRPFGRGGFTRGFGGRGNGAASFSLTKIGLMRAGGSVDQLYRNLGFEPPPKPKPTSRPLTKYDATYVYKTYIPPQDPATIYQLVGFTEYGQALQCFTALINLCDQAELKAIDELIRERSELVVETNLSRTVEQPSSLSEPQLAGDDFRRRGLQWVTALARTELAAMLVGFADHENAISGMVAAYDRDAYRELVTDALRMHYWSLTKDPLLKAVIAGKANSNRTLAYFRRLLIAQAMLRAVIQFGQLTPVQQSDLRAWKANLDKTQVALSLQIAGMHQP